MLSLNTTVIYNINVKSQLTTKKHVILPNNSVSPDSFVASAPHTIDDTITIDNYIYVESIFGKLIGFDKYKIKSSISVNYKNLDIGQIVLNSAFHFVSDDIGYKQSANHFIFNEKTK